MREEEEEEKVQATGSAHARCVSTGVGYSSRVSRIQPDWCSASLALAGRKRHPRASIPALYDSVFVFAYSSSNSIARCTIMSILCCAVLCCASRAEGRNKSRPICCTWLGLEPVALSCSRHQMLLTTFHVYHSRTACRLLCVPSRSRLRVVVCGETCDPRELQVKTRAYYSIRGSDCTAVAGRAPLGTMIVYNEKSARFGREGVLDPTITGGRQSRVEA